MKNKYELVIEERPGEFLTILETAIVPELRDLMAKVYEAVPCLQLQQALIDCESILIHLTSLKEDGPEEPLKDVPLSESEVEEDFIFPEDDELVFEGEEPEGESNVEAQ